MDNVPPTAAIQVDTTTGKAIFKQFAFTSVGTGDSDGAAPTVLWDFGGVFTPSPFTATRSYAESLGITNEALIAIAFGPYDEDTDHPWHKLERGEGTLADAMQHAIADAASQGVEFDPKSFFACMRDDGVDRSVVADPSGGFGQQLQRRRFELAARIGGAQPVVGLAPVAVPAHGSVHGRRRDVARSFVAAGVRTHDRWKCRKGSSMRRP